MLSERITIRLTPTELRRVRAAMGVSYRRDWTLSQVARFALREWTGISLDVAADRRRKGMA